MSTFLSFFVFEQVLGQIFGCDIPSNPCFQWLLMKSQQEARRVTVVDLELSPPDLAQLGPDPYHVARPDGSSRRWRRPSQDTPGKTLKTGG